MIYLDNAATSLPKPPAVIQAVTEALCTCASVGRSGHEAAQHAADLAFSCRKLAGEMFGCTPEQVVFTMNATHGLNLAIHTLVKDGDPVVISGFEHNAVLRPLHARKAKIRVVGRRLFDPEQMMADFRNAITSQTKAVICTHVSNVFGSILPIEALAELCRDREVPLIIDAAQSAGVLPLSMERLSAAFIAMPGHKGLFGPQGTGLLLCGRTPEPLLQGGTGSLSVSTEMPETIPDRAEAGTQNVHGIAGLLEGMRFIRSVGLDTICRKEQLLREQLCQSLKKCAAYRCFTGNTDLQTGVLSLVHNRTDCEILAQHLSRAGFAVRAGLHCAPLAHQSAGTLSTGTLRISPSFLTTEAEIDAVCSWLLAENF